jgi:hypothetical protein
MKKIYTLFVALIITGSLMAQTPQSFKYQAVACDASGDVVADQAVGMQISILQGSTGGTALYVETFTPTTNEFGLINLNIGAGTVVSGDLTTIDWNADIYFVKIEMDITGGTTYEEYGTSQLLSVPYALHAKTAANIFSGNYSDLSGAPINVSTFTNDAGYFTSFTETDPVFGISVAASITGTDTTYWNNKLDVEVDGDLGNELQTLSISNDTIYLTDGSFVKLPAGFSGSYNDLADVPVNMDTDVTDDFSGSYTDLTNTPTGTAVGVMQYWDGSWVEVAIGADNQVLTFCGGMPTWTANGECPPEIGDFYAGGVVFYIFQDGDPGYIGGETHGLVCAVSDQSINAEWGCFGTMISGADGGVIGTGAQNTIDIEAGCTTDGIAADLCANLTLNTYSDWFLPSQGELYQMYLNKTEINTTAINNGGSNFASDFYWSSSENGSEFAWRVHFDEGHKFSIAKYTQYRVRAVRTF